MEKEADEVEARFAARCTELRRRLGNPKPTKAARA
jgi:hypothetical protein